MKLALLSIGAIWLICLLLLRQQNIKRRTQSRSVWLCYEDLLAGGLLFVLTIGFFWRTLSGDVYQPADGGDLVSFLYPMYRFSASQLSQWTLPLWNPHLYGGAPFINDIQAGFLYPPNLILFFLKPDFPYVTMQWLAQLHIFWAGLGVYVLVRTLRFDDSEISRPAAFLAAIAFQFSDPFLIHLGNYNLIAVLSWMGWILAAYHRMLTTRSVRWAALAAILFALANYAGHAQSTMYVGLALAILTVLYILTQNILTQRREERQKQFSFFVYPIVALGLTLLLSAPILLPALEMTQFTERADLSYQEMIAFSLSPTQAIGLITPSFFGRGPALHWGLWDRVETPYAGIVTLLLALAGLTLARKEWRRDLWPWIGLAIFGFVTALGVYAILHGWLTQLLPGFGQFRAPARALVLWTLGLSVLAAVGVDAIVLQAKTNNMEEIGGADRRQRVFDSIAKYVGLVLAGVGVPLVYMALLLTQDDPTMFLRASVASLAITVAAFFWLATWSTILATRSGVIGHHLMPYLVIGLLFFELTANGGAYLDISPDDPTSGYQQDEIVSFLKSDPELFRIDTRTDIAQFWQPDAAAIHELQDVWGIANPLLLTHWAQLWDATGGRHSAQYDMLNVKYVLAQDGVPLPEGKFELVLDAAGELAVHRNLNFMSRAWVVHNTVGVATVDEAFDVVRSAEFDPREQVVLLTDVSTRIDDATRALTAGDSVTVTHFGSSELTAHVLSPAPGYLVLSEVWFPGWQATVNGEAATVERANGALRAVAVPAGESTVALRFAPIRWRWGLIALIVGLVLVAISMWFSSVWTREERM